MIYRWRNWNSESSSKLAKVKWVPVNSRGLQNLFPNISTSRMKWKSSLLEVLRPFTWDKVYQTQLLSFEVSVIVKLKYAWATLVAQMVKNPPAVQETWVRSLRGGHGNPLQYSLPGESPWTEEPGGLQFTGSQRVRKN